MGAFKPKPVTPKVFYDLGKDSWAAYQLVGQAVPEWLKKFEFVYASGDCGLPRTETWDGKIFKCVVGGIDAIKSDSKDVGLGYPWNMYHYIVTSGETLQAYGPFKIEGQHWLLQIPEHLKTAKTLVS